jgi:hypothetical protein
MNNEPVAWMRTNKQWRKEVSWVEKEGFDISLYTHPAKELSYNDIMGTWWETMPNATSCEGVFEFARAILRKAQEK